MIKHVENIMFKNIKINRRMIYFLMLIVLSYELNIDYLSQIFVKRTICVLICLVNIEVLRV